MRKRLRELPESDRSAESEKITAWLAERLRPGSTVFTFANLATEPDLSGLWETGLRLAYPRVSGQGRLEWWIPESMITGLGPGAFGIREPLAERCQP